jgi:hypothetical protein
MKIKVILSGVDLTDGKGWWIFEGGVGQIAPRYHQTSTHEKYRAHQNLSGINILVSDRKILNLVRLYKNIRMQVVFYCLHFTNQ